MTVSVDTDFDIPAPPSVVMDVLRDVESLPDWSEPHKSVHIVESDDEGRPRIVRIKVGLMGISDEQTLEYSWTDDSCAWKLLESGQLREQTGKYVVTATDKGSHVRFELEVDLLIKLPGLLVKQGQKSALQTAKKGLTAESVRRAH